MASKTLASLIVRIGADVTGVTAGLNTLDKRVRKTKKQFTEIRDSTLSWQKAMQVAAGAAGLSYLAKKTFDVGSAVTETASKYKTTFGGSVETVNKFLADNARLMGLTDQKAQELTATMGAVAQGMGATKDRSADLSVQAAKLAGDLASFHNTAGGAATVLHDMQSALVGEFEPMKKYGIVLRQSDINQRAMADSGKKSEKQLTQLEKATAAMALMQERAGVAVGDLARTMDSPANRARRLAAEFLDLRDTIAHGLLPAFGPILEALSESVGGFDDFKKAINENGSRIEAWAKFGVEAFKTVAKAIAAPIQIAFNLGQAIGDLAKLMARYAVKDFVGAAEAAQDLAGEYQDVKDVVTGLIEGFDDMRIASGEAWSTGKDGADEAASSTSTAAAAVNQAADAYERLAAATKGMHLTGPAKAQLDLGFGIDPAALARWKAAQHAVSSGAVTLFNPTPQPGLYGGGAGGAGGTGVNSGTGFFGLSRSSIGRYAGYGAAAGSFLPGKAGGLVSGLSAAASAFASGGPLLGGISLAGQAFKGLSSLFGSGKSKMEQFMDSVNAARQSLDAQFALLDIGDPVRQFQLTLKQAQLVFKGTQFEDFFKNLTPENIQEYVDKLLGLGDSTGRTAKFNLGTNSEMGKAFLDFIMKLESLGDAADQTASQLHQVAINIPKALPLQYLRHQAALLNPLTGGTTGGTGGGTGGTGGGTGGTGGSGGYGGGYPGDPGGGDTYENWTITIYGATDPVQTAQLTLDGIRRLKGSGQSIELDRHYVRRVGTY